MNYWYQHFRNWFFILLFCSLGIWWIFLYFLYSYGWIRILIYLFHCLGLFSQLHNQMCIRMMSNDYIFLWILFLEEILFYRLIKIMFRWDKSRCTWTFKWLKSCISLCNTIQGSICQYISFHLRFEIKTTKLFRRHTIIFIKR